MFAFGINTICLRPQQMKLCAMFTRQYFDLIYCVLRLPGATERMRNALQKDFSQLVCRLRCQPAN